MPRYDYDCLACGRRVEVVHGVHAAGPAHCPNCGGGPLKKAIAAPAVHFKGSGWAKKERRATAVPGSSPSPGSAGASDGDADRGAAGDKAAAETGASAGEAAASPATRSAAGTATRTD